MGDISLSDTSTGDTSDGPTQSVPLPSGRGQPKSHLEELQQLLTGGLKALKAVLGTGEGHAGILQHRQLTALHRPAGTGTRWG